MLQIMLANRDGAQGKQPVVEKRAVKWRGR